MGGSLIAPIQEHMQLAGEAVQNLCQLFSASNDGEWARAKELLSAIENTVSASRTVRREIRRHLPRGLLLAMPRPDLITLLDIQNRMADEAQQIARIVVHREMSFTPGLQKPLDRVCSLLADASGQSLAAIRELDEMLAQGFGKHERVHMEKRLKALDKTMLRSDTESQKLFQKLCKAESSLAELDAVFCFQIVASLGRIAKTCGEVGEQLELLCAS